MSMPTVELSMIVKNGAATLRRCLNSVAPLVDRIVIGDTGSTDESVDIARELGAETVSVSWQNDFADARNQVLAHARCDWVLVLDADEMLDSAAQALLPGILARANIFAYEFHRWNYVHTTNSRSSGEGAIANPFLVECSRPYPAYVRSLSMRLFRRHPGIRFSRPVHEDVTESVRLLGLDRTLAPFVIHHFGQVEDAAEIRARKNDLYEQIGRRHLERNPRDPASHFELGLVELEHHRRPEPALARFVEAAKLDPRNSEAWLFIGICLVRLKRFEDALGPLHRSQQLNPDNIVLQEALGDAHFHRAQYGLAAKAYRRATVLGGTSALITAKLGACDVHLGEKAQGIERVQSALQREPDFPELYDVASATALLARDIKLAAEIATQRTKLPRATPFHFALAAELCASTGAYDQTNSLIQQGLSTFPDDPELQNVQARAAQSVSSESVTLVSANMASLAEPSPVPMPERLADRPFPPADHVSTLISQRHSAPAPYQGH